jgi:uncharacterized protein YdaU (DUF1376 family)
MQLYVSDYLADTAHLNAQQHGAYMLLLMNYWQREKPLDNTGDRLAFVARMTPQEWNENKEILAEFFTVDGNEWTHSRIELDLNRVKEKSAQASFAGRASAVKRALNHKEEDKDKDKDKETTSSFDQFWESYPLRVGKGAALKAWMKAVKRATPQIIVEGACRYASDPNRNPAFTAHPATWLNSDRWTDSPLPPKSLRNGSQRLDQTPTALPPRFTADDLPQGVPMPENIRDLLQAHK